MKKLTVGSCFSGIGGLELGLEWTGGFETKWQIEIDPYARRVLEKHWPRVERYTDITTVERPPRVDVICGGFPCQDVSLAGARAGLGGKRSTLWSELFRLVCEVRPRWLVAENVPGLLSSDGGRFMGNILRDLASIGFDAEWGVLSAAGVGAPHLRRRVFILAYPDGTRGRSEGGNAFYKERPASTPRTESLQKNPIREDGFTVSHDRPASKDVVDAPRKQNRRLQFSRFQSDARTGCEVPDANRSGCRKQRRPQPIQAKHLTIERDGETVANTIQQQRYWWSDGPGWWEREPEEALHDARERRRKETWMSVPESLLGRVAHGIPSRVDRLRCLGNAVVPQVAQKIGEMILNFERAG